MTGLWLPLSNVLFFLWQGTTWAFCNLSGNTDISVLLYISCVIGFTMPGLAS
jgi:hypothetical protein